MTVTTNYLVTGNGITGSTANAVQALVSPDGIPSLTPLALAVAKAAYPGTQYDPLTSTTGWTVTSSGTGGTVTTTTMSDGAAGLVMTVNAGTATTMLTVSASDAAIKYDQTTCIGLWVEVADSARCGGLAILVSNETGQTFTNYNTLNYNFTGGATSVGGLYYMQVSIADAAFGGGSFATAGTISSLRIRANQPYQSQGGSVKIRGLCIDKMARPKIVIAFDDAFKSQYTEAFRYMSRFGLVGTIAVNPSLIGTANYCSWAQLQAMYAAGWHICGHTPSHTAFNSYSTNGIALAQTPGAAGNLTLNGATGAAAFDAPRHVVVRCVDQGRKLTITGLDGIGNAVVEDLYTVNGNVPRETQSLFTRVTQIAIDAAATGNITVGQSLSSAEMSAALTTVRDLLIANAMPRGANDFVYPQGEFNSTSQALLASLGFRSARIVGGQLQSPQAGVYQKFELPGAGGGGAALDATALNALRDRAIRQGRNTIIYLHEPIQTGVPTSTQTPVSVLQAFIDACIVDKAAGKCDFVTQYDLPLA